MQRNIYIINFIHFCLLSHLISESKIIIYQVYFAQYFNCYQPVTHAYFKFYFYTTWYIFTFAIVHSLSASGIEMNITVVMKNAPMRSILSPNQREVAILAYHPLLCSF